MVKGKAVSRYGVEGLVVLELLGSPVRGQRWVLKEVGLERDLRQRLDYILNILAGYRRVNKKTGGYSYNPANSDNRIYVQL
ncbi:hypothetical protein YC2023_008739 [Brassica napus]